jgi:hypothetical protein
MITYIYLVENCFGNSNWIYIGKTINIKDRNYDHRITYGEQIQYSIIDQINSLEHKDWKPLESYWIEQFRQWGFNVLNKNKGGGGPNFHTEDVKNRLKFPKPWVTKDRLGKKHTEIHKQNITKGLMGKKQSKETIEKRSQKLKGQKRNDYTKKLMSEAKQGVEITWGDKIKESKALNPYIPSEQARINISDANSKPIEQYSLDNILINTFSSATEAMKQTGVKNDNISHCLREKTKTAGGFIWKFKK